MELTDLIRHAPERHLASDDSTPEKENNPKKRSSTPQEDAGNCEYLRILTYRIICESGAFGKRCNRQYGTRSYATKSGGGFLGF